MPCKYCKELERREQIEEFRQRGYWIKHPYNGLICNYNGECEECPAVHHCPVN